MPVRGGVHRLQRHMGGEGVFVIGFDRLGGLGKGCVDVTDIVVRLGRELGRHRLGPSGELCGGILRCLAEIPVDLQLVLGLEGAPGVLGNDGDAGHRFDHQAGALDGESIDDAALRLDLVDVEGTDLAASGRAFGVAGVNHAGALYVDAEERLAGHHLGVVDAVIALADQAVFGTGLQRQGLQLGHCEFGRGDRQRTIGGGLAAGGVGQHRIPCGDLRRVDVPKLCRGGDQHGFGTRAGLAQLVPGARDRGRAAGALVAIDFGVDVGLFHHDVVPVRIQFLGDDDAEGGLDALADLRGFGIDGDGVVRGDADEGVHRLGAVRRLGRDRGAGQAEAQDQPGGPGPGQLEEHAPPGGERYWRDGADLANQRGEIGVGLGHVGLDVSHWSPPGGWVAGRPACAEWRHPRRSDARPWRRNGR